MTDDVPAIAEDGPTHSRENSKHAERAKRHWLDNLAVIAASAAAASCPPNGCIGMAGHDGLCGKTRKLTGRENFDFARRASSAQAIVAMRRMGGPHAGRSPARPNPRRIFLQGRLWPFKL